MLRSEIIQTLNIKLEQTGGTRNIEDIDRVRVGVPSNAVKHFFFFALLLYRAM
jgi:hypothetical protein